MKITAKQIMPLVCLLLCAGCDEKKIDSDKPLLADCPEVGRIEQVGDYSVVVADQSLLKDTIDIPLSMLTEEISVVKLDNRDEALVGETPVVHISDNYILVGNNNPNPFKLFDREGNFMTHIGSFGQGPGEYQMVYHSQLDETNGRIYILPWQSDQLLVYDLKGNILSPIPLGIRIPKGIFHVDQENSTIAVIALPFQGYPAVAWAMDMEGNRKHFVEPGHLALPFDFSNEVISSWNNDRLTANIIAIMPTRVDSLYQYDYLNNHFMPTFTMNFSIDPIPWHGYMELSDYFIGDVSFPVQVAEGMWNSSAPVYYIVDKKTTKGAYFRMHNDYLGGSEIYPLMSFRNGYYVANMEPIVLKEQLEKAIERSTDNNQKKKWKELAASLDENDNNVILFTRLKKS